jgi:hypothetical protein
MSITKSRLAETPGRLNVFGCLHRAWMTKLNRLKPPWDSPDDGRPAIEMPITDPVGPSPWLITNIDSHGTRVSSLHVRFSLPGMEFILRAAVIPHLSQSSTNEQV